MISIDSLFNFGRKDKLKLLPVDKKVEVVLKAELDSREQKFRMVGPAGKHVFAYDVGGGVCVRLYHSGGITIANKDHERYSELSSIGFSVPTLHSNVINDGGKYAFATSLITGRSIGEHLTKQDGVCDRSDYLQIIELLQLSLRNGWWPREFNVVGNTLREASSGKIFSIDVGDWIKIGDMSSSEATQRENEIRSTIEFFNQLIR